MPKIPNNPEVKIHIRFHNESGTYIDLTIDAGMENIKLPKSHINKLIRGLRLIQAQKKIEDKIKQLSK